MIESFRPNVPETQLNDLRDRLAHTRWPDKETVNDTSQGPPLAKIRALSEYWLHNYDWRRCEALLNGLGQYRTNIDGLGIHFVHVRSPEADALPLLMTHGWPGSVLEFRHVIGSQQPFRPWWRCSPSLPSRDSIFAGILLFRQAR